ncbi:MAG: hypothetical protein ACFCU1_06495 [Sumerlaeia bacterium]
MHLVQFTSLLIVTAFTAQASAATLIVTTTNDENDGSSMIGDGLSLRDAIMLANANPNFDTIVLPGGTYTLTIPEDNSPTGSGGSLDIQTDLEIISESLDIPVINGNGTHRIFNIENQQTQTREIQLIDLRLTNGFHPNRGGAIFMGPSVRLSMTAVEISGSVVAAEGESKGGAIYFTGTNNSLIDLVQCSFVGNSAGQGSVIYSSGTDEVFMNYTRFAKGSLEGPRPEFYFENEPLSYDFGDNWFGSNAGPGTSFTGIPAPGFWVILTLNAVPATPPAPGGFITLTASANETVDLGTILTPLQSGIPLTWTPGTAEPRNTEPALFQGFATSTIEVQTAIGTATESVTLDEETVSVELVYGPNKGTILNVDESLEFDGTTLNLFSALTIQATGAAQQFTGARVQISPLANQGSEFLSVDSGTLTNPANATYDSSTGTLEISQLDDAKTYETILQSVKYFNGAGSALNQTPRTITITLINDPVTSISESVLITFSNNPVSAENLWVITGLEP